MSVDPGLGGTGWAFWHFNTLISSGSISAPRNLSWEERAKKVSLDLCSLAAGSQVQKTFIEQPFIALQGKALVSARSGDVVKLSILNGMITASLPRCEQVRVIDWKGQTSKSLFKRRIMKYLQEIKYIPKTKTNHELDAIGIGRYILMKEKTDDL